GPVGEVHAAVLALQRPEVGRPGRRGGPGGRRGGCGAAAGGGEPGCGQPGQGEGIAGAVTRAAPGGRVAHGEPASGQVCLRHPIMTLAIAHSMPTVKIAVPKTKTCGGMPIRVAPYTQTGNGVAAPLTKFDVTKSSMDSANAISAPARMPGMMSGKVILRKMTQEFAPRSAAASSSDRSKPVIRARTVTVTYAMLNATCASSSVTKPRATLTVTNSPSSEAPSTISGAAMLRNIVCSTSVLPRKRGGW